MTLLHLAFFFFFTFNLVTYSNVTKKPKKTKDTSQLVLYGKKLLI